MVYPCRNDMAEEGFHLTWLSIGGKIEITILQT